MVWKRLNIVIEASAITRRSFKVKEKRCPLKLNLRLKFMRTLFT
jgi:hypothetical protein